MSARPTNAPNWPLRLAVVVVLAGLGWLGVTFYMRPTALVAPATTGIAVRSVPGTVEVKAEYIIELKSEVGGRISTSQLAIGKRVARNDVLVQIDTGDIDLEIERIKNEIIAAKRKVELGSPLAPEVLNARDTLENLERQTKAGAYPPAEFAKQQRLFQQLEQRKELDEVNARLVLQNFENTLRAKEREKAKMTITAPSDGVITMVMTRVGDLIGSNSPIATIISVGRTVEARISEENFSAVKLGQKASVRLLTFGADQYNGTITKILPAADAATRRYTIFLELVLPEGRVLMPGLTGEVSIIIEQRANAVTVPRRAVVGDSVFVAEGGKVTLRKIKKGFEGLNEMEITAGLKAGELVVVEQQDRFHDGERVRTELVTN